jgi:hypothetical protein
MRSKTLLTLVIITLVGLAGLGLAYPEQVRARLRPLLPAPAYELLSKTLDAGRGLPPGKGAADVYKCLVGTAVHYSTEPCPPGSQETAMTRGTVTVLAAPAAALPASAPASLPTVRDLLAPPGKVDMQEQRIDQATR